MTLALDREGRSHLEALLQRGEDNRLAVDFYDAFLAEGYADLSSLNLKAIAREGRKPVEKAYFEAVLDDLGMAEEDLGGALVHNRLFDVACLDSLPYRENPYRKRVAPKARKEGEYRLCLNEFLSYEGFLYEDVKTPREDFYSEIYSLGFFSKRFSYLQLLKDETVWMSITPYEINTMEEAVARARGHVLAYGLGLGYYPFMALLKKEVEDVSIVESDPIVISFFTREILPFFPRKEKVRIVREDAYRFRGWEKFDSIFVDLYRNEADGLPFYLNLFRGKGRDKVDFWIESSLLAYLRRFVLLLLEDAFHRGEIRAKDPRDSSPEGRILTGLNLLCDRSVLKTAFELDELLSQEGLKRWASAFPLEV